MAETYPASATALCHSFDRVDTPRRGSVEGQSNK